MARFEQTFLRPGRYGSAGEWTKERIAAHVQGTKELLAAGHKPFLFFEHPAAGTDEGSPIQFASERDRKAHAVKHGAGWLVGIKQAADGSGVYVLEATDSDADRKLREKSIQFTSPEFRPSWKDGQGREFKNIISHVALTHKPRAADQGPIEPLEAIQFSLADYEGPIQMADDDDKKPDDTEDNPDMPKLGQSPDKAKYEAVAAHLKTLGAGLPDDTDETNFLDRLLTALLTIEAVKAKETAEKPKEDDIDPLEGATEKQPPFQFSLAEAQGGKLQNKALARAIKAEHAALTARLDSMVRAGKVTPACKNELLATAGALQFSEEGEHAPAYTLPQLVDLLDRTTIAGMGLTEKDLQFAVEQHHPRGDAFLSGNDGSDGKKQGEQYKDAQLARRGLAKA